MKISSEGTDLIIILLWLRFDFTTDTKSMKVVDDLIEVGVEE